MGEGIPQLSKVSAKHIEFINLVSKGTSQQDAYRIMQGNKSTTPNTARVAGCKLAKRYAKEIQEAKEQAAQAVSDAANESAAQIALKSIVSQAEADAKVFRILSEDDTVEDRNAFGAAFLRQPTQTELQKAYDLYCKRFGSYQPVQTKLTGELTITEITGMKII